jgi:hypothetical protein
MRSGAHLILGLPGESWSTLRRTWRRVVALDPDYVSFNVLQRRRGAPLAAEGRATEDVWRQTRLLPWARRCVTWGFYLRPRYVLRQLAQIRSPAEARSLLRSGVGLLWQSLHGDEP